MDYFGTISTDFGRSKKKVKKKLASSDTHILLRSYPMPGCVMTALGLPSLVRSSLRSLKLSLSSLTTVRVPYEPSVKYRLLEIQSTLKPSTLRNLLATTICDSRTKREYTNGATGLIDYNIMHGW